MSYTEKQNPYVLLREHLGWSQEGLAMRLGLNRSSIQQYERGDCDPNPETKRKLIDLCLDHGILLTPLFFNYQVGGIRFLGDLEKNERKRQRKRERIEKLYQDFKNQDRQIEGN